MRAVACVVAAVLVLAAVSAVAQDAAVPDVADASEQPQQLVVAKTMKTAKIVAPKPKAAPKKLAADKANAKAAQKKKSTAAKAAAAAAKGKKTAKPKLQPGQASLAAAAAAKEAKAAAPKDQLMAWIRSELPSDTPAAELKKIELYLNNARGLYTFADLFALGEDGVKALTLSDKLRAMLLEKFITELGRTTGADDQMLVPTPPLKKAVPPKKKCGAAPPPRFVSIPVNNASPSPVGDWLRKAFPDMKPLRLSRTILALQRQTIRTFADLQRIGVTGVAQLLYIPDGIRAALRDAIVYDIGISGGHDDGKPVTARHYVPPKPVKADDCA